VADQDDAVATLHVFVGRIDPAKHRLNAKRGEDIGRRREAGDLLGPAVQHDVETGGPDHAEVLEGPVALAPRKEIGRPNHVARPIPPRVALPDRDDPLRVAVRQRLEHDTADHAVDGGGRADPERQRQHGRDGKPRRANEPARGETKVLHQIAHWSSRTCR
jgi:hypothetical protein